MKILTLDLSEASTGLAFGDGAGPPLSWTLELRASGDMGMAGAVLYRNLRTVIVDRSPDMIVMEAPLLKSSRHASTKGVRLLTGLAFMAHSVATLSNIRSAEVAVQTWRKMFIGHGRPENPKEAALISCNRLGWDHGGNHDRAEAMGIWAYAQFQWGDRRAIMRQLSNSAVRSMSREGNNGGQYLPRGTASDS